MGTLYWLQTVSHSDITSMLYVSFQWNQVCYSHLIKKTFITVQFVLDAVFRYLHPHFNFAWDIFTGPTDSYYVFSDIVSLVTFSKIVNWFPKINYFCQPFQSWTTILIIVSIFPLKHLTAPGYDVSLTTPGCIWKKKSPSVQLFPVILSPYLKAYSNSNVSFHKCEFYTC